MNMDKNEPVIVAAVRTPIGRGHRGKGQFRDVHPTTLLGLTYRAVVERPGLDPILVDDVIAGAVNQFGEQGYNIARNAWLAEGLPQEVPASTLDRQCGSAQTAVNYAAALVKSGASQAVIGAGVEHLGRIPLSAAIEAQDTYGSAYTPAFEALYDVRGQGIGAELIAEAYGITRREMDELAVESHRRAAQAWQRGVFSREIVPVPTPDGLVSTDQGVRPEASYESVSGLRPAFKPDGRITAAASSQISDGAAAVLVMSRGRAEELGLRPRARIIDHVAVGCDPVKMLEGPIPATQKILDRNGITMADIDRIEINEAFASVVAAWAQVHKPDMDKVNVRGGAMALGHPLGSTGARLITSLLHILEDEDQQIGMVTMCCGGGLGTGTLIERCD